MNYSVGGLQDLNNTNVTEVPTEGEEKGGPCDSGLPWMRLVAEVYIVMPIAAAGIVGNILAFIVLCNHKNKLSTTIILQCLALVDTLILAAVIPMRSIWISTTCLNVPTEASYKEAWKLIFRCIYPLLYVLRMVDTWLITLLTLDRWIAVCRPLHAHRLCTRSSTYKRLVILIVAAIVFSLPRLFESTQYGVFEVEQKNKTLNESRVYTLTYRVVLFFIFMYLIPMALLIVLNVQLIMALRMANASFAGRRHSQSSDSAQRRGITVIVITVVTTCVVCNLLAMVSHLMQSIEFFSEKHKHSIEVARRPLSIISNVMIVINSAINFALYCFSSKNFRQVTFRTLGCDKLCKAIGYKEIQRHTSLNTTCDTYMTQRQSNGHAKENDMKLRLLKSPEISDAKDY